MDTKKLNNKFLFQLIILFIFGVLFFTAVPFIYISNVFTDSGILLNSLATLNFTIFLILGLTLPVFSLTEFFKYKFGMNKHREFTKKISLTLSMISNCMITYPIIALINNLFLPSISWIYFLILCVASIIIFVIILIIEILWFKQEELEERIEKLEK